LLVVLASLHLLIEAILEHLFLELFQGGLDLVVEHHDFHSGHPEMPRRSTMGLVPDRVVDDVHLLEPFRPVLDGPGNRGDRLARLLDDLARVVDDAPAPEKIILWGRDRRDLHASTTDSDSALHRCESRRPGRRAWRALPSAFAHPAPGH